MICGINIVNFDVFDNDLVGVLAGCESAEMNPEYRMRGLNALIGRNNTGKSSFINAMSFLKDTVTDNVADASNFMFSFWKSSAVACALPIFT